MGEEDKVVGIFRGGLFGNHVVPTLHPDEAFELVGAIAENVEGVANFCDHFGVILSGVAGGAGWAEVFVEALAAPGGFDEKDGSGEVVSKDVADLKFGSDVGVIAIAGVADGELAFADFVAGFEGDLDVVALDPIAVAVAKVYHLFFAGGILYRPNEVAFSSVVILRVIHGDDALAFHVGLSGEDEDLDWGQLLFQPRGDFLSPGLTVFFLSESAEVHAFSVLVPVGSGESIGVRAFEGGAGSPECFLPSPEIGRAGVVGRVVACLGNEPGSLPFGDAVGLLNELGEVFLVKSAGEGAGGIALIGVGFTLMP